MKNIVKIFNSEDKDELKQAFKEIIKEQFRSQIENMELHLFDLNKVEELINEAFQDIVYEVKFQLY